MIAPFVLGGISAEAAAVTVPSGLELDGELSTRIAVGGAGDLEVVILLDEDDAAAPASTGPGRLVEVRAAVRARQAVAVPALERAGLRVEYASDNAGVLVARGSAAAVRAAAATGVRGIYLARTSRPRLDISRVVTQASIVQAAGIDGTGVRVAVVEDGRIASTPALPAARRLACRPGVAGEASYHKTAVAAIIQSNDAVYRGMAPRVTLIDANAADLGDAEVIAATDCAVRNGAIAINMSFGVDSDGVYTGLAAYVDRLVYNTGVSVVVAVSNDCTLRMGSPEIAYNDISTGAFSDRNTLGLADDRHTCLPIFDTTFSAYRDPPSRNGDREQPDVVAPGHLIRTYNIFDADFGDDNGTSFAAPHVVGEVALLHDRAGAALIGQAERVRAIVMASARHNVEGASRLSDRDGAGAVRFAAADAVLRSGQSWWFGTPGGSSGFPHVQTFAAKVGQKARVALVWAHKPGFGSARVSTDLNLTVCDPSGAQVARSASFDNNFEIVEFVAARSGNYSIRVDDRRPSRGREHVGLAVSRFDR